MYLVQTLAGTLSRLEPLWPNPSHVAVSLTSLSLAAEVDECPLIVRAVFQMASHSSVFRGRHATHGKEGPLSLLFDLTKILSFAVGGEAIKVANRHRGILLTELLNSHKLSYLF